MIIIHILSSSLICLFFPIIAIYKELWDALLISVSSLYWGTRGLLECRGLDGMQKCKYSVPQTKR